jgi:hypothetical protein
VCHSSGTRVVVLGYYQAALLLSYEPHHPAWLSRIAEETGI